jgi:ketosteroid isomerase-like protein
MRPFIFLAMLLPAACVASAPRVPVNSADVPTAEFQETVRAHIAAIKARDLDALMRTVTTHDSLTVIFPGGETIHTRDQYVAFHRTWFADTTWTMDLRHESFTIRSDFGVALLRTTYTDAAGPRQALLSLTFAREPGGWRLVFDQNTRVVQR